MTFMISSLAQANKVDCAALFKASHFTKAAKCYVNKERALQKAPGSNLALQRDRLLRNAAFSYHHAAKKEKRIEQRGYLKMKAVSLLVESFQKGYCEASDRCRTNRTLADRFRLQIGYANLAVVTGNPKARVLVEGYRFRKQQKGNFTQSLRPGRYTVTIQSPGAPKRQHSLSLRPRRPVTLDASKARIKVVTKRIKIASKTPPLAYAGYASGGVLFATGIVLATYGLLEQKRLDEIFSDPNRSQEITDTEYKTGSAQANTFRISGLVIGVVGLLTIGGAIIIQLTARRQLPPPSPQSHLHTNADTTYIGR